MYIYWSFTPLTYLEDRLITRGIVGQTKQNVFLQSRYEKRVICLKKGRNLLYSDFEAMASTRISLDQIKAWRSEFLPVERMHIFHP